MTTIEDKILDIRVDGVQVMSNNEMLGEFEHMQPGDEFRTNNRERLIFEEKGREFTANGSPIDVIECRGKGGGEYRIKYYRSQRTFSRVTDGDGHTDEIQEGKCSWVQRL